MQLTESTNIERNNEIMKETSIGKQWFHANIFVVNELHSENNTHIT